MSFNKWKKYRISTDNKRFLHWQQDNLLFRTRQTSFYIYAWNDDSIPINIECLNQSRQSDKLCMLNGLSNIYYNSGDWEGKDVLDSLFSYFLIYTEQPSLYTHMAYSCSLGSYFSPSFIPKSVLSDSRVATLAGFLFPLEYLLTQK